MEAPAAGEETKGVVEVEEMVVEAVAALEATKIKLVYASSGGTKELASLEIIVNIGTEDKATRAVEVLVVLVAETGHLSRS